MGTRLSKPEQKVLFALAEDATRTDAQIADRISMKDSTVGQNRRKLLKNKHMEFINVPSYHKLGFEFLLGFINYVNPALYSNIDAKNTRRFFEKNPEIFDAITGDGIIGGVGTFKDITSFLIFSNGLATFFENHGWPRQNLSYDIFPFDISRGTYLYNFAPSLARLWDLEVQEPESKPLEHLLREKISLSKTEARVLREIVASPLHTDFQIAQHLKRSRQSISEMRNDFFKRGILKREIIPVFESGIFSVLAIINIQFESDTTLHRKIEVAGDEWWQQSYFTLERDTLLFSAYLFNSPKECHSFLNEYIRPFQENALCFGEPKMLIFQMEHIVDLLENSFAPILRQSLP